jgi:hypothetical protein
MSLQTLAVQLRLELDDLEKTRWIDEQLLVLLQKSARRINQLAIRHSLDFAMRADDVTLKSDGTIDGIVYNNVNAVCSLVRKDTNQSIKHLLPLHYLRAISTDAAEVWTFLNGAAVYKSQVSDDVPATFLHYPRVVISSTESPWNERLDDLIVEYAALRAKNIDEENIEIDIQLEKELEQRLLENYNRLQTTIAPQRGWNY